MDFYSGIVSSSVPSLGPRMDALVRSIRDGLAALEQRMDMRPHDVVHGDFYEAQVFVENGKVVGLLDIDTVGPGRRSDDLACLLAHLSVLADYGNAGRIDRATQERVEEAIRTWHEVFSDRVDPTEPALRSAGVVLSLATGPHRQQEASWEAATEAIVRVAEEWVSQARGAESQRREAEAAKQAGSAPATGSRPIASAGPTGGRQVPPQHAAPHSAPPQHAPPQQQPAQRPAQQSAPSENTGPLPAQSLSPRPVQTTRPPAPQPSGDQSDTGDETPTQERRIDSILPD